MLRVLDRRAVRAQRLTGRLGRVCAPDEPPRDPPSTVTRQVAPAAARKAAGSHRDGLRRLNRLPRYRGRAPVILPPGTLGSLQGTLGTVGSLGGVELVRTVTVLGSCGWVEGARSVGRLAQAVRVVAIAVRRFDDHRTPFRAGRRPEVKRPGMEPIVRTGSAGLIPPFGAGLWFLRMPRYMSATPCPSATSPALWPPVLGPPGRGGGPIVSRGHL
ncbi:hypothetical protein Acsp03_63390 [Actinomadura sp. NBRC 104412]|nr:hypothetical protein Acsp03_63390 [Actinomadura sp. NBRC 104412]